MRSPSVIENGEKTYESHYSIFLVLQRYIFFLNVNVIESRY